MAEAQGVGPGRGERAPDFVLPTAGGGPVRFYSRAGGRSAVLWFCDSPDSVPSEAVRQSLAGGASCHAVVRAAEGQRRLPEEVDVFVDDGTARRSYRLPEGGGPCTVVLDANLRVLAVLGAAAFPPERLQRALEEGRPAGPARTVTGAAPVLFVPRALPEDLCRHLMALWESGGNRETGVERRRRGERGDGRAEVVDAAVKQRRDHVADAALTRVLTQTVGRRLLPEVGRAFACDVDRFEGFKIACYDAASGGFFEAHRDNLSPATAHRRFAMSLNLNADYAGGELRFPEYGNDLYRPAAGEALVFGCGLLHEVVPVAAGRRFVLLSFLYGGSGPAARAGFDPFGSL